MARLWEPLWSLEIKIHQLVWYTQMKAIFPKIRCHNIECATWATKLVCQVEVTGLARVLQKCIFRFCQEENNGFHLNEI